MSKAPNRQQSSQTPTKLNKTSAGEVEDCGRGLGGPRARPITTSRDSPARAQRPAANTNTISRNGAIVFARRQGAARGPAANRNPHRIHAHEGYWSFVRGPRAETEVHPRPRPPTHPPTSQSSVRRRAGLLPNEWRRGRDWRERRARCQCDHGEKEPDRRHKQARTHKDSQTNNERGTTHGPHGRRTP